MQQTPKEWRSDKCNNKDSDDNSIPPLVSRHGNDSSDNGSRDNESDTESISSSESCYDKNVDCENIGPVDAQETILFLSSGTRSYTDAVRSNRCTNNPNSVEVITRGTEKKRIIGFNVFKADTTFSEKHMQDLRAIRDKRCKLSGQ